MDLHHTTGVPDWANVAPEKRNKWQIVAAATKGVVTPGNAVSFIGLALVTAGFVAVMQHALRVGLWLIVLGRLCDLADGLAANRTGTKSPLGEAVDASFDKAGALGILIAFGAERVVPLWAIIVIAAQNIANIIIAYIGKRRKVQVHPVRAGKVSAACEWLAFFCFIAAAAYGRVWFVPAYVILLPALWLGVVATIAYARVLFVPAAASAIAVSKARRT